MDMMTNIIRSLSLFTKRPSINKHSQTKTAQSLLSRLICCTHFLLSVGSSIVSDIYLSYFPFETMFSYSNEHYILLILEHEYSKQLCVALSDNMSKSDKQKQIHHEKKIDAARNAQHASFHLQSTWPSIVSKKNNFLLFNTIL